MNARKLTLVFASMALAGATVSVSLFAGCGSDNNGNPAPTNLDSGGPDSTNHTDTGTGPDSSAPSPEGGSDVVTPETSTLPDTGGCVSDSSACNTCYNDAQAKVDPYNACSPYTAACVPVTLTVPDAAIP